MSWAKLIISKSSNMNEKDLLNELQTTDFDDIFKTPKIYKGIQTYLIYYDIEEFLVCMLWLLVVIKQCKESKYLV